MDDNGTQVGLDPEQDAPVQRKDGEDGDQKDDDCTEIIRISELDFTTVVST